jgi:protease II
MAAPTDPCMWLEQDIQEEIKQEIKEEMMKQLKQVIKEEIKQLKEDIKEEMKEVIKEEKKEVIKEEIKEEINQPVLKHPDLPWHCNTRTSRIPWRFCNVCRPLFCLLILFILFFCFDFN